MITPGLMLAVVSSTVQAQPDRSHIASVEAGRRLVTRDCGMCHAVGANDRSRHPGAPAFRRLGERYDVDALGEGLAEGILTGHPAMPEFRFEPDEVVSIVMYLHSLDASHAGAVRRPLPRPPRR